MPRVHAAVGSGLAAVVLVAACATPSGTAPESEWSRGLAVVKFSYRAVAPETVRITADGNVTWVNAAPDTRAFVVFPASIASDFRCADLRPYFSRSADTYRSIPITAVQSAQLQLPCSLAPGSYDYEIWIEGTGLGAVSDAGKPERVLRARIVVD
jgi:hypothetical protein